MKICDKEQASVPQSAPTPFEAEAIRARSSPWFSPPRAEGYLLLPGNT